jgi:dolichyl-phosphate beta-glucosyltransferase
MDMELSVIIPAYNEVDRLPAFLNEALDYLDAQFPGLYEIIVVDDGSVDDTAMVVEKLMDARPCIHLIRHQINQGKGAAVRSGLRVAHGRLRLFADADGATPIEEEQRLRKLIEAGADAAIGSRATRKLQGPSWLVCQLVEGNEVHWEVKLHRQLIGRTFAALTKMIVGLTYADTQCGFKMFRAHVADDLFSRMTMLRFIFDVEILYVAQKLGYQVVEVPVNWHEVHGSKVRLVYDSWRMFCALWQIAYRHAELARDKPAPKTEPRIERSKCRTAE